LLAPHSIALGAAGYNMGDVAGALLSLLYLVILYSRNRRRLWGDLPAAPSAPAGQDHRETLRAILRIGLPVALLGAAPPLIMYSDTFVLGHALLGATSDQIKAIYGQLTSGLAIVWVPAVFTGALYTAVVPAMAEAIVHQQRETAHRYGALALRATMLIAWPAATGLAVLAFPIFRLCFHSVVGANLLVVLAVATVPIMVQQTTAGILQGMGHVRPPVVSLLIGTALKVILTLILGRWWGAPGAAWATVLGFLCAALFNLVSLRRRLGLGLDWAGGLLKPAVASLVMGAGVYGGWRLIDPIVVQPWIQSVVTVALVGLGVLLYAAALLLVKGASREDVERLPYVGQPVTAFLARLRLL
ncbi:MAG: polysaccharide biosynthesis C-terminal domain-containing protein, partial [Mycobacterium leprae]